MSRILVCEDNADIRIVFKGMITSLGRICETVETPREVLDAVQTLSHDMVLLHLNHGQQGPEFIGEPDDIAKRIRDSKPNTVVIGYSGAPSKYSRREVRDFHDVVDRYSLSNLAFLKNFLERYGV